MISVYFRHFKSENFVLVSIIKWIESTQFQKNRDVSFLSNMYIIDIYCINNNIFDLNAMIYVFIQGFLSIGMISINRFCEKINQSTWDQDNKKKSKHMSITKV